MTSIGSYAFEYCTGLTSVTIPNSVTSIGDGAFAGCSSLTSVTIPNSVTSIGRSAFFGCTGLTSVTIPNSVTDIGVCAFLDCSSLTSVTIGNSVTSIGDYAFADCTSLTSVTIPNSVTSIGSSVFRNTPWLENQPDGMVYINSCLYTWKGEMPENTSVEIKEGTTTICGYAFENCTGLASVTIPNSVTSIGGSAFNGCSNLSSIILHCKEVGSWFSGLTSISIIEIGDEVETIGNSAFKGCTGLNSVIIGKAVNSIGSSAFSGCTNLSSVAFHCKEINGWFRGMTSIKSIYLGDEVEKIGVQTFMDCRNLTSVTIGNSLSSIGMGAFSGCPIQEIHISDLVSWLNKKISPQSLSNAGYHLFFNEEEVKDLVIPNSVTSIGYEAFCNCIGLSSITIPNSVTSIGDGAFYGCKGLTSVTIPNSVTYIGWSAFSNCTSLEKINMPASLQVLGRYCIEGCTNMNKIIIDDISAWCNVVFERDESWGNDLFEICPHLYKDDNTEITHLVIPEGVERVGALCFENCEGIKSITLPKSIRSIGVRAFSRTGWWEAQSFGDIMYIDHAFIGVKVGWDEASNYYYNKDAFNEVNIKEGTTVIADNSSWDSWSSLELLSIPNTVVNIGARAFTGSKIQTLTIPNSVETIDDGAFDDCAISSLTIGKNVKRIGERAFSSYDDNKFTNIISLIEEPFDIEWHDDEWNSNVQVFDDITYTSSTLYVPKGTKEKYEATAGWNKFQNIIELAINPVDSNDDVDYGGGNGEIDSETNLSGNVVGNIYYSISDDNGAYSSTEGCIVVRKPTCDDVVSSIGDDDLFSDELKDTFTGIIFMVQPGSGTITVNAESEGSLTLKVKVGDNPPTEIELSGKMKAKFPYSVSEASYVYVYAGGGSSGAKAVGTTRSSSEDVLKIYGIEWTSGTDGISTVSPEADVPFDVYTLTGNKVRSQVTTLKGLPRGVYVVNGRKMVVE